MGLLLGKLRKKKSAVEELEGIDKEIKSLEESRKDTELTRRRIVGRFVLVSVIVYVLVAFIFYFFFFPASFYDRLYYIMPLIVAPVIIIVLKRTMAWYFNKKITKAQTKLSKLQDEKKRLIDKVMETETYKVAKQILDKYAPEQNKKPAITTSLTPFTPTAGLRQRNLPRDATPGVTPGKSLQPFKQTAARGSAPSIFSTPMVRPNISKPSMSTLPNIAKQGPPFTMPPPQTPSGVLATIPPTPMVPTPKSILPKDRSVFDKMVDYLVGDGPSNRYALICQYCYSHNGMALKEEAKYTSFRCCYCYAFNPALVKKPQAPKLEYGRLSPNSLRRRSMSESDKNESSETEDEEIKKAIESVSHKQATDSSEGDERKEDFGSFSEIHRKFSEIESTIAEIKKAEIESTDEMLNETNKNESNVPENELASFEFVSIGSTNEDSQSLMKSEDNGETPVKIEAAKSDKIEEEHVKSNQKDEEASTSLSPTTED